MFVNSLKPSNSTKTISPIGSPTLERVNSKVDGIGSKQMVRGGLTERSKRLKLDGHESNWAVQTTKSERDESGRS